MDEEKTRKKKKRKRRKKHVFGRLMAFLGLTLLCVVITLLGVVWEIGRAHV